ncbi:MAG: polyphosphate polymerase domain-containing protein, partial [Christensenellaceae bacterium]|nr:polyphosphate polymerase domain-containing protein [Christensenellaceae bacterium]
PARLRAESERHGARRSRRLATAPAEEAPAKSQSEPSLEERPVVLRARRVETPRPQPAREPAPKREARVRRSLPEQRTQVATAQPESIFEEKPITIDTPKKERELPSAEFGSWRAKQAMPAPKKKVGEDGRVVDKATFAADKKLRYRHELKFYINYRDYMVLRQALKVLLTPDDNGDENNSYHIRSLYFDDRDEKALVDKQAGVEDRSKFRIRIYNFSDDIIRLEKKIKKGQYIAKKSLTLTREEYEAILAGDIGFLLSRKEDLAREMYLEMRIKQLRPRVVVDYVREAYIMPYESVRITFDKQLKSGRPTGSIFDKDLPVVPIADPETMILEVKFNRYLPDYVKGVLANLRSPRRSAISKYTNCRKYE